MLAESSVYSVKATHNFKGSNNDELCFKKGDVITVTQALEGGWWEGTLNGVTGWFPSNYVKEIKQDTLKMRKSVSYQPETPLSPKLDTLKMYRGIVFKDIVDTESNHLNELQNLVNNYLNTLKDGHVLNEEDYALLRGNIDDVLACNIGFLKALEEVQEKPPKEQKIGGIFMQVAPQMKKVNFAYCSNHPKAASTIDKHKDELEKFMEEHGATSPGLLTLTTGLSSPFRRLEKYPALLQELQRHTEESHIDRGDTQRAIFVFRDLAAACLNIRRQKENELEVMSGNIRGWEGEDIQSLGEILHMGLVVFLTEDQERKDRYLVVFPRTLVILSVSPRMSAFIYEGKLPLSGVTVKKLDPSEGYQFAFEISGNMIQRIIVICASQELLEQWLNLFQSVGNTQVVSPVAPGPKCSSHSSPSHSLQAHSPVGVPQQQLPYNHCNNTVIVNEDRSSPQINRSTTEPRINNKVWTSWSLMPHPPMRPNLSANKGEVMLRRSNSRRKEKVPEEKNYEGDMKILQVIEAYCTSAKSRYTVNSAFMDTPNIMIAEEDEEKIIIEEFQGESTIIEEKNLVETICALKDQIHELKLETCQLFKNMDEEKRARQRLELLFQKYMLTNCQDTIATHFKD